MFSSLDKGLFEALQSSKMIQSQRVAPWLLTLTIPRHSRRHIPLRCRRRLRPPNCSARRRRCRWLRRCARQRRRIVWCLAIKSGPACALLARRCAPLKAGVLVWLFALAVLSWPSLSPTCAPRLSPATAHRPECLRRVPSCKLAHWRGCTAECRCAIPRVEHALAAYAYTACYDDLELCMPTS